MLPADDEQDDAETLEPEVARTARAVHLRNEGDGITLRQLRHISTKLPMDNRSRLRFRYRVLRYTLGVNPILRRRGP